MFNVVSNRKKKNKLKKSKILFKIIKTSWDHNLNIN